MNFKCSQPIRKVCFDNTWLATCLDELQRTVKILFRNRWQSLSFGYLEKFDFQSPDTTFFEMNLSMTVEPKEVLIHFKCIGRRRVSKEQLKSFILGTKAEIILSACWKFILDLKTRIKSRSRGSSKVEDDTISGSKISRTTFESHIVAARDVASSRDKRSECSPVTEPEKPVEVADPRLKLAKNITSHQLTCLKCPSSSSAATKAPLDAHKSVHSKKVDEKSRPDPQFKSKMWIRPRSGSHGTKSGEKKTDPVSLYQSYQKDWIKFKPNICEATHADLRWRVREMMLTNH